MTALPCGHEATLFETTKDGPQPIVHPGVTIGHAVLPATVWCRYHGWVKVDDKWVRALQAEQ